MQDLDRAVNDQFQTSGHGSWQGLAASTLRRKAKAGKSSKPLIWNGTWMNSPTLDHGEDFASIYANVPYAVFHVSSGARSKIPLRNPYDLGDDFYEDITERLAIYAASGGKEGI